MEKHRKKSSQGFIQATVSGVMHLLKKLLHWIFSIHGAKFLARVIAWFIRCSLSAMAVTGEMVFHRRFGERYWLAMIGSMLAFFLYFKIAPCIFRPHALPFLRPCLWLFSALCLFHCLEMLFRARRETHSFGTGVPWIFCERLSSLLNFITRYAEPIIAFGLGHIIERYDAGVGFWWKGVALGMFVRGQVFRQRARTRLLEAVDSRIESKQLQTALTARTSPRHAAVSAEEVTAHLATIPPVIGAPAADHFADLGPELKNLMSGKEK